MQLSTPSLLERVGAEQCGVFALCGPATQPAVFAGWDHEDPELLRVVKLKLGGDLCKGAGSLIAVGQAASLDLIF